MARWADHFGCVWLWLLHEWEKREQKVVYILCNVTFIMPLSFALPFTFRIAFNLFKLTYCITFCDLLWPDLKMLALQAYIQYVRFTTFTWLLFFCCFFGVSTCPRTLKRVFYQLNVLLTLSVRSTLSFFPPSFNQKCNFPKSSRVNW